MAQRRSRATLLKPQGQPTRGKTAPNRLRRVDNFLALYDPGLFRRQDGLFADSLVVDLGYGADPVTTLESAARLRRLNPALPVLGVEIDPERVAAAQPFADALTSFRLGGFNLPLLAGETVRCIRAFNVLRQYAEGEVAGAYALLARSLLPGGLLIEGTSEPYGRLWVANVLRKPTDGGREGKEGKEEKEGKERRGGDLGFMMKGGGAETLVPEALVFSTNFRLGFDPADFQAVLPKNLIHRVVPGEPIHEFFTAWRRAALETSAMQVWGARQWFRAAAERLAEQGYEVVTRPRLLNNGWLVVRSGPAAGIA